MSLGMMSPNRARLWSITRNVQNIHDSLCTQDERLAKYGERLTKLHEEIKAMQHQQHVLMQTMTSNRKRKTIQDEYTFIDDVEAPLIYCPSDVQELIMEMFPTVADIFHFISDHEVETKRYHAKKQRCDAEHPAQPTNADMFGHVADSM